MSGQEAGMTAREEFLRLPECPLCGGRGFVERQVCWPWATFSYEEPCFACLADPVISPAADAARVRRHRERRE